MPEELESRMERYLSAMNAHLRTLAGEEGDSIDMSGENYDSRVERYLALMEAHLRTIAEGGGTGSPANPSGVTQQYVDAAVASAVGAAIGGGY